MSEVLVVGVVLAFFAILLVIGRKRSERTRRSNRRCKPSHRSQQRYTTRSIAAETCPVPAGVNPAMWMLDLMKRSNPSWGKHTLLQVTLPGTHDSGSFVLSQSIAPGALLGSSTQLTQTVQGAERVGFPINHFITPWGVSQRRNIYQQCQSGIRYFDLRVAWSGTCWRIHHTELGSTVVSLLTDVLRFLNESRGEVIVLEMGGMPTPPLSTQLQTLLDEIQSIVGTYLCTGCPNFPSISSMVATNKRLILTLNPSGVSQPALPLTIWSSSVIRNTYANTPDLPTMITYNTAQVKNFRTTFKNSGKLNKLSWTLTPDTTSIVEGSLLPVWKPSSLLRAAALANAALPAFILRCMASDPSIPANIIIVDSCDTSTLVPLAIRLNTLL